MEKFEYQRTKNQKTRQLERIPLQWSKQTYPCKATWRKLVRSLIGSRPFKSKGCHYMWARETRDCASYLSHEPWWKHNHQGGQAKKRQTPEWCCTHSLLKKRGTKEWECTAQTVVCFSYYCIIHTCWMISQWCLIPVQATIGAWSTSRKQQSAIPMNI